MALLAKTEAESSISVTLKGTAISNGGEVIISQSVGLVVNYPFGRSFYTVVVERRRYFVGRLQRRDIQLIIANYNKEDDGYLISLGSDIIKPLEDNVISESFVINVYRHSHPLPIDNLEETKFLAGRPITYAEKNFGIVLHDKDKFIFTSVRPDTKMGQLSHRLLYKMPNSEIWRLIKDNKIDMTGVQMDRNAVITHILEWQKSNYGT